MNLKSTLSLSANTEQTTPPEAPSPADSASRRKPLRRPAEDCVVTGWRILLRNWRCVFWAYLLNVTAGLLTGIPFAAGTASYLDHSLGSQRIAGTLDAGYLNELAVHLFRNHLLSFTRSELILAALIQFLLSLLLTGGTIRIYLAAEPPRLPVLLARGSEYFGRMLRVTALYVVAAGLILAGLIAARSALLAREDAVHVERAMFYYSAGTGIAVALVLLLFRLWFDFVEVYAIRIGGSGERRIRRALKPALHLLFSRFWSGAGSFFLIGLAGLTTFAACIVVWKNFVPPVLVWAAALTAQLALCCTIAARYWQRAAQVALVLAEEPWPLAMDGAPESILETKAAFPTPPPEQEADPTLRDLVLKLQREPLINTDAPANRPLLPDSLWPGADKGEPRPPQDVLLEAHDRKLSLAENLVNSSGEGKSPGFKSPGLEGNAPESAEAELKGRKAPEPTTQEPAVEEPTTPGPAKPELPD